MTRFLNTNPFSSYNLSSYDGGRFNPPPPETVSRVRSWFDKLTTNGPRCIRNQYLAVRPERIDGRTANGDAVSDGRRKLSLWLNWDERLGIGY